MRKSEAEKFAKYEVFFYEGKKRKTICVCQSKKFATKIAKSLAERNAKIYVTYVDAYGYFDAYWRDENGELKSVGVS